MVMVGVFKQVAESGSVDSETTILLLDLVDVQCGLIEADWGLAVASTSVPHLKQAILSFMSFVRILLGKEARVDEGHGDQDSKDQERDGSVVKSDNRGSKRRGDGEGDDQDHCATDLILWDDDSNQDKETGVDSSDSKNRDEQSSVAQE